MAVYEITDGQGNVINTIIAGPEFVEAIHPGQYRELPAPDPVPVEVPEPSDLAKVSTADLIAELAARTGAV